MKGKVAVFVILLILAAIILPTFSYVLRDQIEVYKFSVDKLPDNYIVDTVKNIDTYKKFISVVDPPNVTSWIIVLILLYSQLIGSLNILKINAKYSQKDTYGSHGTSRWQTKDEIHKNYYKDQLGWFIGSTENNQIYKLGMNAAYLPLKGSLNMQVTVIGGPGSNKTAGYVLPNLFHIPYAYRNMEEKPDIIITDPKSELFAFTADYYEKIGYEIRCLDFIHLQYMDSMNCLDFTTTEKEIIELGEGYVKSVGGQDSGRGHGDSFWDDSESQLLSALIGYVLQAETKDNQTFTRVAQILSSDNVSDPMKAINFFKKAKITGAALQLWNNFLMAEDKVRANILIGLATKLRLFAISGIQNITNSTTLDITKLGAKKEKPIALYIFMPDGDRTFSPIINVVVTTILKQLYKTAYKYNNKLYCPVYFLLEEMANIGKITGLSEMLGTMRGRRIYPMMVWQSLSQMKQRYPDGWEDILSMCDTHIYLKFNDEFTSKYASNAIGDTTINIQGISRNYDGAFGANKKSESSHYQARKLIQPEECKRLDPKKLIISQSGFFPVMFNKVQYQYWIKDENKICETKDIFELPLITDNRNNVHIPKIDVNNETDKPVREFKGLDKPADFREVVPDPENEPEIEIDIEQEVSGVMFTIDDIEKAPKNGRYFDR